MRHLSNQLKIGGDRPIPFIFASMNYASLSNGATVTDATSGTADFDSLYPLENMFKPNKHSFTRMSGLASRTGNHITIRLNLSATIFATSAGVDGELNLVCVDSNLFNGVRAFRLRSYTDANYSANVVYHTNSAISIDSGFFKYGAEPRIDTKQGHRAFYDLWGTGGNKNTFDGFDGKNSVILLSNGIQYDHPYVVLELIAGSYNMFGHDGTFDNGLWDSAWRDYAKTTRQNNTDENSNCSHQVLGTTLPCTTNHGTTDNYIYLSSTSKTVHQTTEWIRIPMRSNHEYVLKFWEKTIGTESSGRHPYEIEAVVNPLFYSSGGKYQELNKRDIWFDHGELSSNIYYVETEEASPYNTIIYKYNEEGGSSYTLKPSGASYKYCKVDESNGVMFYVWNNVICKLNLSTLSITQIKNVGAAIGGIALDRSGKKVYYTVTGSSTMYCVGYDSPYTTVQITITGLSSPYGLCLDITGNKIYWINGTSIWKCNLDGSSPASVVSVTSGSYNIDVDLTSSPNKLYWTDTTNDRINRINVDGTTNEIFATELSQVTDVSIPESGTYCYYSTKGNSDIKKSLRSASAPREQFLVMSGVNTVFQLHKMIGSEHTSWTQSVLYFNILDSDNTRVIFHSIAGATPATDIGYVKFNPDRIGTLMDVWIRFKIYNQINFSPSSYQWYIDELECYDANKFFPPETYEYVRIKKSASEFLDKNLPNSHDFTGSADIARFGLFSFKFALSSSARKSQLLQDLAGNSGIITNIQDTVEGGVTSNNVHGDVVGTFISSSGTKRAFNIDTLGNAIWKAYLESTCSISKTITIIDPKGEFTECIILPGSIQSVNTDTQSETVEKVSFTPPISDTYKVRSALEYMYQITFTAKEV